MSLVFVSADFVAAGRPQRVWTAITSPTKVKLDRGGDRSVYDLIKKGANRLIIRVDTVMGGDYTDTLNLVVE